MEKFFFIEYCVLHGIAFLMIGYISIVLYKQKNKHKNESKNKVHFYVARDKGGKLWLYIGKPIRGTNVFYSPLGLDFTFSFCSTFNHLGLNKDDYNFLKWEDEPVEVFVNLED